MLVATVSDGPGKRKSKRELWPEHRAALHEHGLSNQMIDASGVWSAKESEVTEVLGFNPARSAGIVIPYRHPLDGRELMYRVRLDIPAKANGKEIRYLGAKGVPNRLFFPPGWDEPS
jgi:hypothetical protein